VRRSLATETVSPFCQAGGRTYSESADVCLHPLICDEAFSLTCHDGRGEATPPGGGPPGPAAAAEPPRPTLAITPPSAQSRRRYGGTEGHGVRSIVNSWDQANYDAYTGGAVKVHDCSGSKMHNMKRHRQEHCALCGLQTLEHIFVILLTPHQSAACQTAAPHIQLFLADLLRLSHSTARRLSLRRAGSDRPRSPVLHTKT